MEQRSHGDDQHRPDKHDAGQSRPDLAARIVSVEDLFTFGCFRPASVQRDYQWTPDHCATLLRDLRHVLDSGPPVSARSSSGTVADVPEIEPVDAAADDDPVDPALIPEALSEPIASLATYYLGAMVLMPGAGTDPDGAIEVYDGLQRLTTLTMLIALLRDLSAEPELKQRLARLIMAAPRSTRLNVRAGTRILKEEVQPPGTAAVVRKPRKGLTATESRMRAAMAEIRSTLAGWDKARMAAFAVRLLEDTRIAVTEVHDARMARKIFVSTNLYGARLNRVDLFKGQMMDLAPDSETADAIRAAWERATRAAAVWDPVARAMRDDMDRLLVAVDFIERRAHQGVDCLTELAEHLGERPGPDGIRGWVEQLEKYADAWRELHERIVEIHERPIDKEIWKLRFFWWDEWKPLALLWYRDYIAKRGKDGRAPAITWVAFVRRFKALHGRCLAIILADYSPGERATIFGNAIVQTRHGDDPLKRALAFEPRAIDKMRRSLKVPLTDINKRLAAVQWIEAAMWGDDLPTHLGTMQVEHVLPQNPAVGSAWHALFPDEEDRYDAAHSLGNLACLDSKRNRELGNSDYEHKREAYAREPVFKTLQQVAASSFWTGDMIRAREHLLVDYVFERLELPIVAPGTHQRTGSAR